MLARVGFLGLSLALLGCVRDNPAFDQDTDTAADESGSNEQGDGDGDPPGDGDPGDGDGDTTTTDGDCGMACGPCQVCEAGQCVAAVGQPCDGPVTECSDYLQGLEEGVCHAYPPMQLGARCNEDGQCTKRPLSECPDALGEVVVACDEVCIKDPGACAPGTPVEGFDTTMFCVLEGPGPDCHTTCDGAELVQHECMNGICTNIGDMTDCGPFVCNPQTLECYEFCEQNFQCVQGLACNNGICAEP